MGFFEDLFNANGTEYFEKAKRLIESGYQEEEQAVRGVADAALREQKDDLAASASRGGYAGSPVEAVVRSALIEKNKANEMANVGRIRADKNKAMSGLEIDSLKDKREQEANNLGTLAGTFKMLGSIFGWLNPTKIV